MGISHDFYFEKMYNKLSKYIYEDIYFFNYVNYIYINITAN